MPKARVNGLSINYELHGDPRRETLVLIHGLGGHLRNWDRQTPAFAREHQVLVWDMRGFGASERKLPRPGLYTRHAMAADLAALLKRLRIPQAHILGHSLGGLVALQFALSHPRQTRSLIVVDSSAEIREPYVSGWDQRIAIVRERGIGALQDDPTIAWGPAFVRDHRDFIEAFNRESAERNDPLVYAEGARISGRALFNDPLAPHLPKIVCRTLIICGAEDKLTPPGGSVRMSRAIRDARLAILPGSGHFVTLEVTEEFNRTVLEFLRGLGPRAG